MQVYGMNRWQILFQQQIDMYLYKKYNKLNISRLDYSVLYINLTMRENVNEKGV